MRLALLAMPALSLGVTRPVVSIVEVHGDTVHCFRVGSGTVIIGASSCHDERESVGLYLLRYRFGEGYFFELEVYVKPRSAMPLTGGMTITTWLGDSASHTVGADHSWLMDWWESHEDAYASGDGGG
jgi:hypothetical protein